MGQRFTGVITGTRRPLVSGSWNWGKQSFVSVCLWGRNPCWLTGNPIIWSRHHHHLSRGRAWPGASGRLDGDKVDTQCVGCSFSCTKFGWFLDYQLREYTFLKILSYLRITIWQNKQANKNKLNGCSKQTHFCCSGYTLTPSFQNPDRCPAPLVANVADRASPTLSRKKCRKQRIWGQILGFCPSFASD